jgi:hypothetical protein
MQSANILLGEVWIGFGSSNPAPQSAQPMHSSVIQLTKRRAAKIAARQS